MPDNRLASIADRARMNSLAARGQWKPEHEKQAIAA